MFSEGKGLISMQRKLTEPKKNIKETEEPLNPAIKVSFATKSGEEVRKIFNHKW